MRYIYIDEAGISANEPITVVASVIVHADSKFLVTEKEIDALFDKHVPDKLREGFIFHATKLYSGTARIEPGIWKDGARWALLEGMVALPKMIGLPVSVGICRRGQPSKIPKMRPEQSDHAEAFLFSISLADRYLRKYTREHEVGCMVVEDAGKTRKILDKIPDLLRSNPFVLPPEELASSGLPSPWGDKGSGEMMVEKIRDGIYWQDKKQARFLQLADAWAFAWRLFLSSPAPDGERLMRAAFGGRHPPRECFPSDVGANSFIWSPRG